MFFDKIFSCTFFLFLIFTLLNCANVASDSNDQTKTKELNYSTAEAPFAINYQSHQHSIKITDSIFSHHRLQHHFPENSPSSVPDSISKLVLIDQIPLNNFQINELQKTVNNGFLKLGDAYGAPQDQRHYPYSILVKTNGIQKKVIYRSNPSFDEAPYPFKTLESVLFNLSQVLSKTNESSLR